MEHKNLKTNRTKVKRVPQRGLYDPASIYAILDAAYLAHIGFNFEGQPFVIPTMFGRKDNFLYLHGAASSRMIKSILDQSICVTISLVDGLVLARSGLHHSMNYRSVVLLGKPFGVENLEEKEAGLKIITDHLIKDRWEEVRPAHPNELKATSLLKLEIKEASAKVRTGHPKDEKEDHNLDIWAGQIPLKTIAMPPIDDELLRPNIPISPSVLNYCKKHRF